MAQRKPKSLLPNIVAKAEKEGFPAGQSGTIRDILETAHRLAKEPDGVVLYGEKGTGKTSLAHLIHLWSGRKGPFVECDLLSVPIALIEAELFGVSKGAFSDAVEAPGAFEKAHNGTLLLRGINHTPDEMQRKVLYIIRTRRVVRLGASAHKTINVRIIATMLRDPAKVLPASPVQADLIFQLGTYHLRLPALRERKSDIEHIARQFLNSNFDGLELSPDAIESLSAYDYPGNIPELYSILANAAVSNRHATLTASDFNPLLSRLRATEEMHHEAAAVRLGSLEQELEVLRSTTIRANPIWQGRFYEVEEDYCFVLMPFGPESDVQSVYSHHVRRVVEASGMKCERADDIHDISGVMQSVWECVCKAKVIIAEMTNRNSNVFYELGIAHTLGKPVIMITQSMDFVPFDLKHLRCIVYDFKPGRIEVFENQLSKTLKNVLASTTKPH